MTKMKDSEDAKSAEYQDAKLTDLEDLEVNRRMQVAIGVLPRAIELFKRRKQCTSDIEASERKENREMWLLLSAIVLTVGHLILIKGNLWTSLPGGLAIMLICWFGILRHERYVAYRDKAKVADSLMALSVTFYGAAEWRGFWSIDEFCETSAAGAHGFDADDERIQKWLFRIRISIIYSVCGVTDQDRLSSIGRLLSRRHGFDENEYRSYL